jgi:hypothetical protein
VNYSETEENKVKPGKFRNLRNAGGGSHDRCRHATHHIACSAAWQRRIQAVDREFPQADDFSIRHEVDAIRAVDFLDNALSPH